MCVNGIKVARSHLLIPDGVVHTVADLLISHVVYFSPVPGVCDQSEDCSSVLMTEVVAPMSFSQ